MALILYNMNADDRAEIKQVVQEAMLEVFSFSFNKSMAAKLIGIGRTTLYQHINNNRIELDENGNIPMSEILKHKRQIKQAQN